MKYSKIYFEKKNTLSVIVKWKDLENSIVVQTIVFTSFGEKCTYHTNWRLRILNQGCNFYDNPISTMKFSIWFEFLTKIIFFHMYNIIILKIPLEWAVDLVNEIDLFLSWHYLYHNKLWSHAGIETKSHIFLSYNKLFF